jgi:hypothetical protein
MTLHHFSVRSVFSSGRPHKHSQKHVVKVTKFKGSCQRWCNGNNSSLGKAWNVAESPNLCFTDWTVSTVRDTMFFIQISPVEVSYSRYVHKSV